MYPLLISIVSFFSLYPQESNKTISDFVECRESIQEILKNVNEEDRVIGLSIVAPEYSQYSRFLDFIELRTLYIMYLNTGTSSFSVGPFQMKPNFIEDMEEYISSNRILKKKYEHLLPRGSSRDKRKFRLENLSSWIGQLKYLELFIAIAKDKTKNLSLSSSKDKLFHWATLYNGGIKLSNDEVSSLQNIKQFPRYENTFNYAQVAYEFYGQLQKYNW